MSKDYSGRLRLTEPGGTRDAGRRLPGLVEGGRKILNSSGICTTFTSIRFFFFFLPLNLVVVVIVCKRPRV